MPSADAAVIEARLERDVPGFRDPFGRAERGGLPAPGLADALRRADIVALRDPPPPGGGGWLAMVAVRREPRGVIARLEGRIPGAAGQYTMISVPAIVGEARALLGPSPGNHVAAYERYDTGRRFVGVAPLDPRPILRRALGS